MTRDTCFAMVDAAGRCGSWHCYRGLPGLCSATGLDTSLPRSSHAPLDDRLRGETRLRFHEDLPAYEFRVDELRDWLAALPVYTPPSSLLETLLELDGLAASPLDADLALRLFLEYLVDTAERRGARAVLLRRD